MPGIIDLPNFNCEHLEEIICLLQLTITWYKIRHAGGQAYYYSRTGTSKQRQVKLHWFRSPCFNVPVRE